MAKQGTAEGGTTGTCPDAVKRLIDRFEQQSDQIRSADYSEALIRIDFINPLMRELGWDIDNSQGFAEQYREVVHEDRVESPGGPTSDPGLSRPRVPLLIHLVSV